MKLKQTALALVSAGLLSVTLSGTAQADVIASSVVNITNFQLSSGGVQLAATDFSFLTFTSSADYSGSIGASNFSNSAASATGSIDFAANSVGNVNGPILAALGVNLFPKLAPPPLGNYAAADQLESGAPISGIAGFAGTATVANSAYAGVNTGTFFASAASNNNLNSSLVFSLAKAGGIDFSFLADAFLLASVTADESFPSFATAALSVDFTLTNLSLGGTTVFTFSPNLFGDGTKTLSLNAPLPVDITLVRDTGGPTAFSGSTGPLTAGTLYQLSARLTTSADAQRVQPVPEPASLALIGMGLLGMGLARLRKAA